MYKYNGLYIGLMTGTSVDGIDCALVEINDNQIKLVEQFSAPLADKVTQQIHQLTQPGNDEIEILGSLDRELGIAYADACLALLQKANVPPQDVIAIGSHGQTIRHRPQAKLPFSLQIGDPNTLAQLTGITTIADFRRRDLVLGGQGAPLAPAFHHALFAAADCARIIVNIGGIANITVINGEHIEETLGYDTGPGNTLLDNWCQQHIGTAYDSEGNWARSGEANKKLLEHLFNDPYFKAEYPKSTGREYFNLEWLASSMGQDFGISAVDLQATLVDLTALSITQAIATHPCPDEVLICGGGVHNSYLMERLQKFKAEYKLTATDSVGINPDWIEAMAFAWLARQRLLNLPGNIPAVTGASDFAVLGAVYN